MLKICEAHEIVYDEDKYEDGCPLCDAGAKIAVLEQRLKWEENIRCVEQCLIENKH